LAAAAAAAAAAAWVLDILATKSWGFFIKQ
jgi:hypothetical protein